MALQIQTPFAQFFDLAGTPVDNGDLYIGTLNLNPVTDPIAVYWDEALTIPALQPINISNGYISRMGTPSRLYTASDDYSMLLRDSGGSMIFYEGSVTAVSDLRAQLADGSSSLVNSSIVGFIPGWAGSVTTAVENRLKETISVKDFGATGDGVTDDTAEILAAVAYANSVGNVTITFPIGTYLVSAPIRVFADGVNLVGAGPQATIIKRTTNYGDTFQFFKDAAIGAYIIGCGISDMSIYSTIMPSSGAHILARYTDNFYVDNVILSEGFNGIQLSGCHKVKVSRVTARWSTGNPTGRRFIRVISTQDTYTGVGQALNGSNVFINNCDLASLYTPGGGNAGSDFGIEVTCIDGLTISNTYVGGCATATMLMNNSVASPTVINGIKISNSFLDAGQGADISMQGSTSANFGNVQIIGNSFAGGTDDTTGVVVGGNPSNVQIISNTFYGGNKSDVITLNSTGVNHQVIGNHITKGGVVGAGDGVKINSGEVLVSDNIIGAAVDTIVNGVSVSATSAIVKITDNVIVNCTTSGITLASGATVLSVTDNILQNNVANLVDNSGDIAKTITNNAGYNPVAPTAVTVGATPFTWKNTTGGPVLLFVNGGTVNGISVNSSLVAANTDKAVTVPHQQSAIISYTVLPTVKYLGA